MNPHALRFFVLLSLAPVVAWAQASAGSGPSLALGALTLRDAEVLLVARNRDLQLARRASQAAEAGSIIAGAPPNPQFTWTTQNINPSKGIGAGPPWDKTVDTILRVDQLIERGGKRELRKAAADGLVAAAGAELDEVLRRQRLALAVTYYELLAAQDRVAVAAETAGLWRESVSATELRLKAGDVAAADLSRLRVDELRAQNDLRAAQAELARAQVALGYLIGTEQQAAMIRAVGPWPAPAALAAVVPNDEAIDRRPDVRAAMSRVEASQKGRELARALRTRDVTLGVQYEHWPTSSTNDQGTGNSFGVSISVPLFVRYHYEGEIARAEAEFSVAGDALERARAQARAEAAQALSDLRAAADRLERFERDLLVEARRAAAYAEFAYRSGTISVTELLDARRTLRATQLDSAQARADYAKALAAWRAGAGELALAQ
jgi:cobalt-zinc-cadmium efflux system outer membrane protein